MGVDVTHEQPLTLRSSGALECRDKTTSQTTQVSRAVVGLHPPALRHTDSRPQATRNHIASQRNTRRAATGTEAQGLVSAVAAG
jgi:hypothetical protein